jgi:hypothetical protein
LSGPKKEDVRNMSAFLLRFASRPFASSAILDKSTAARATACVRKTTRREGRAMARGFGHDAVLQGCIR